MGIGMQMQTKQKNKNKRMYEIEVKFGTRSRKEVYSTMTETFDRMSVIFFQEGKVTITVKPVEGDDNE